MAFGYLIVLGVSIPVMWHFPLSLHVIKRKTLNTRVDILSTMPTMKRERAVPRVHEDIQTVASPTPVPQPGFPYIPPNILNPLLLLI